MSIMGEIVYAIKRDPKIKEVIVSPREYEAIRAELEDMSYIKPAPRPTYGPPFGNVDRLLWDEMQSMKKLASIRILDRPVVVRDAA